MFRTIEAIAELITDFVSAEDLLTGHALAFAFALGALVGALIIALGGRMPGVPRRRPERVGGGG